MAAVDVVDAYLSALPGETRRLAHGEWGITMSAEQAAGWPLEIGVRVADGLLRVQAFALAASEQLNPWNFLHWNRQTRLTRFACTSSGDILLLGELPVAGLDEGGVDRLLGLVVEGALLARSQVAGRGSQG
jgi:hypothetical protein